MTKIRVFSFGTSMASSINSFSKTTKWILMIFVAKQSWESTCFVSAVSSTLLLCREKQNLWPKFKTMLSPSHFSKSASSPLPCWKSTMPPMPTWIIYKYRILNFPPPSVFFSYLSSWWSPSLSPNGAVCDGILQIKKILTRNQEWKCLPPQPALPWFCARYYKEGDRKWR